MGYNRKDARKELRKVIGDIVERPADSMIAIAIPFSSRSYEEAVMAAGGVAVPIDGSLPAYHQRNLLDACDGLLLTGGEDIAADEYGYEPLFHYQGSPRLRDEVEFRLLSRAHRFGQAIFGVCRGHQLINVGFGGTLIHDINSRLPRNVGHGRGYDVQAGHKLEVVADGIVSDILNTTKRVNSIHHQAVDRLSPLLKVTAKAPDGVVEAVEYKSSGHFVVGVQFHPEQMQNQKVGRALFKGFVQAAGATR